MVEKSRGGGARIAVRLATAKAVRATDMAYEWRVGDLDKVLSNVVVVEGQVGESRLSNRSGP